MTQDAQQDVQQAPQPADTQRVVGAELYAAIMKDLSQKYMSVAISLRRPRQTARSRAAEETVHEHLGGKVKASIRLMPEPLEHSTRRVADALRRRLGKAGLSIRMGGETVYLIPVQDADELAKDAGAAQAELQHAVREMTDDWDAFIEARLQECGQLIDDAPDLFPYANAQEYAKQFNLSLRYVPLPSVHSLPPSLVANGVASKLTPVIAQGGGEIVDGFIDDCVAALSELEKHVRDTSRGALSGAKLRNAQAALTALQSTVALHVPEISKVCDTFLSQLVALDLSRVSRVGSYTSEPYIQQFADWLCGGRKHLIKVCTPVRLNSPD